jgi:hypothetical protein
VRQVLPEFLQRKEVHSEELHNLYSSANITGENESRMIIRAGYEALTGELKNSLKNFGRKPEAKRALGRRRRRWEDNIKMDLKERRCENVNWIHVARDTV